MKKFLLSSVFLFMVIAAFSQSIPCPSTYKRNNGNSCKLPTGVSGTGGSIEIGFASQPAADLQIYLIVSNSGGGTATVVEETKDVVFRAGTWYATWCFETDNLGPISQGSLTINFYHDVAPLNQYNGEQLNICSNASLPVIFKSFNAVQANGKVSLTWETAQEINNKEFQVQRRNATGGFETIATIPSQALNGNSATALTYKFDDLDNLSGKGQMYYRIKQVDINGQTDYSETRSIRNNARNVNITVYPNPGRDLVKVTIPDGVGLVDVSVSDMSGKEVKRWNSTSAKNIELTNLRPGLYTIRVDVKESGDMLVNKLIIQ